MTQEQENNLEAALPEEDFAEDPPKQQPQEETIEGLQTEQKEFSQDTLETEVQEEQAPEQTEVQNSDELNQVLQAEASLDQQDADVTTESVVEAVLFASDEPLTVARLADIVGTGVKQTREHIENLNSKYESGRSAFRIEQIAGGYQMLTLSSYNHWLKKLLRIRDDGKLSPAALETLAIIAYKQPIIRADIESIRGVAAGEMIRSLMYKGLVKIVGRAEILGRPMLYGTTKKFLEIFGLNSLKDLPKIEELKKPAFKEELPGVEESFKEPPEPLDSTQLPNP